VTPVTADLPDLASLDSNPLRALLIEKHTLVLEQRAAIEQQRAALDVPVRVINIDVPKIGSEFR